MGIDWTDRASSNLADIKGYIAKDDPMAAQQTVGRIASAVEQIPIFPRIGRPGRVTGTRELVVSGTRYIVPYRVNNERVEIIAVLHGARKWPDNF